MKLSVVIPSLNDAAVLRTALADLALQTRPADEIVVVDNGSEDDTAEVARAAGARVIAQPVRGIPSAASTGYDAATGDIIARLDADSRPGRDWLERIEHAFETDPGLGVLTGPGDFYGDRAWANWVGEHVYIAGYFHLVGPWLGGPPIFGSNFAMRRSIWLEVSGLVHRHRNDLHDDLDLVLHLPADVIVEYDRTLRVGVSSRPFDSAEGLWRRITWAFRTFAAHWPDASPWELGARRRAARRAHRAVLEEHFGDDDTPEPQPAS